jgi:rhodanese-related sulfurtransferase
MLVRTAATRSISPPERQGAHMTMVQGSATRREEVPERKRTILDLYITAGEAYAMWQSDPEGVHVVDVRTPEEHIFVGHPAMARNIPLLFVTYAWDTKKGEPVIRLNPGFVPAAAARFGPGDALAVMCRSGGRSALAVNALAEAGFERAYNVIDGFEGDKVDDPTSAYDGKRMKNGWRNSALPWTYDCDTALLWTDSERS